MASREHVAAGAFAWRTAVVGMAVFALLGPPSSIRAAHAQAVPPPARVADVNRPQVSIDNFTFNPATLTVPSGTTVTWTNQDDMVHTVTEANRLFSSKGLETGDVYTHTFTMPGTYIYFCALHPRMTATVIVK